MIVGYAVLYEDGELVISKNHTLLQKKIERDYGQFEERNVLWKNDNEKIKTVRILNQVKSNYMNAWFENCVNLTTLLDFQNLDVSDCKNFAGVFYNCQSLTDISSLKNWNISNGIIFSGIFSYCTSLQNINVLENWNFSNGEYFQDMFENCISLKKISLPNTIKFVSENMFFNCNSNLKIHWKEHIYTYEDLIEYKSF